VDNSKSAVAAVRLLFKKAVHYMLVNGQNC